MFPYSFIPSSGACGPQMLGSERLYWMYMSALLDPAAHVYKQDSSTPTVPANRVWGLRNASWVKSPTGPAAARNLFQSDLSLAAVTLLSPATVLDLSAHDGAFAYTCRPELAEALNPMYASDPKGLFFQRWATLTTLALQWASVDGTTLTQALPASQKIMLLSASCHDMTAAQLTGAAAVALNIQDNISDAQGCRFTAGNLLCPIDTSVFTTLTAGTANGADAASYTITFAALPADW
jgi:hypothetical protein